MPIREFTCPIHGKFEKFCGSATSAECPVGLRIEIKMATGEVIETFCKQSSPVIEFSVPAKRNPRHGEG
jgi:hypothetical protein